MELNLTNILVSIIALSISVIAIKITFSFDINEYLKVRKKSIDNKIKNYCTHAYVNIIDDDIGFQSAFISPSGTTDWVCQRCKLVVYHIDKENESKRIQNLLENPKQYKKQEKKFERLLKKGHYI